MKKNEENSEILDEVVEAETAEETTGEETDQEETVAQEDEEQEEEAASEDAASDEDEVSEKEVADDVSEDKPRKSNLGILIAEGVIAVAAIGFIGFAVGSSIGKNKNKDTVSENIVSEETTAGGQEAVSGDTTTTIDNSDLEALRPAVSGVEKVNKMTKAEADAEVNAGTMIKLKASSGEEIYVPNYEDPEVLASMVNCDDEIVMTYINDQFLSQISEMEASDKTDCESGDVVNIDYVGTLDGVAFDGGTDQGCNLELGSGSFIDGFEEGLIGHKVGDVVELSLTFPENYYEDLAGKDVVFTVSINSIMQEVYPELTDTLVEDYFGESKDIHTKEECIAFFREQYILNELYSAFSDKVYESGLNEENVILYYDYNMDYYCEMYKMYYGQSLTTLFGEQISEFLAEVMTTAEESSYNSAIFRAIAEKEKLTVEDADIEAMATDFGYTSVDEFLANYDSTIINDAVLIEKVLRAVNDNYYSKL